MKLCPNLLIVVACLAIANENVFSQGEVDPFRSGLAGHTFACPFPQLLAAREGEAIVSATGTGGTDPLSGR